MTPMVAERRGAGVLTAVDPENARRCEMSHRVFRSRHVAWALALVCTGPVAGCNNLTPPEADTLVQSAVSVPPVTQFFILARRGVTMGDRASESGGSIGVSAGTGTPANTFSVGFDGHVAIGKVIVAPKIVVQPRTTVGNLDANQITATGATTGTRAPFQAPPTTPSPGPVTAGTTPISVPVGQSVTLVAGQYGAVAVSGTLVLAGGTYQIASLTLDNDAHLVANASAVVRVAGGVTARDRVHVGPAAGLHARDLRLEVAGAASSGTGVQFGTDAQVTAVIVAQLAFQAADRLTATGTLAADRVTIGNDPHLTFDGGFACASNSGCPGGACVAGACTAGAIAGQVVSGGAPVAGAVVTLRALTGPAADLTTLTAVTDAQGRFQINGVPAGVTYEVTARFSGASLVARAIAAVIAGQIHTLAMGMDPDACNVTSPTLTDQVTCCKQQLGIDEMPPAGSCTGGNTLVTSTNADGRTTRLGYFKVSDDVDAVFHCDQIDEANQVLTGTGKLEMSIHSRSTGNTCFLGRKLPFSSGTAVAFPSLDDVYSSDAATVDAVNNFWDFNTQAGTSFDCATCHRFGGPYIIESLSKAMATFGLLNNGHDTKQERFNVVDASPTEAARLTSETNGTNSPHDGGNEDPNDSCANGCHRFFKFDPLPNLSGIADELANNGLMPPVQSDNDYRWMNRDTPAGPGDSELLEDQAVDYGKLFTFCPTPFRLEAHVVGSGNVFATDDLPDTLSTFNLRDGLVCNNNQQTDGQCNDYSVRYLCEYPTTIGFPPDPVQIVMQTYWTDWINNDNAGGNGDSELTSDLPDLCHTPFLGHPIAMQADTIETIDVGGVPFHFHRTGFAPNDRLSAFDASTGLVCLNSDQPSGESCSNYVVRFVCPG
jgi:hypothetical protein